MLGGRLSGDARKVDAHHHVLDQNVGEHQELGVRLLRRQPEGLVEPVPVDGEAHDAGGLGQVHAHHNLHRNGVCDEQMHIVTRC